MAIKCIRYTAYAQNIWENKFIEFFLKMHAK